MSITFDHMLSAETNDRTNVKVNNYFNEPATSHSGFHQSIAFAQGVFAVQPSKFRTNEDALADNKFMSTDLDQNSQEFDDAVQFQHANFVANIRAAGVPVTVLPQMGDDAPDSVFPDWFTCYKGEAIPGGVLILHPMLYQSRRNERTPEVVAQLKAGFKHVIDLTHFESEGKALEGKGSIVFHHRARCFFVARSNRSHPDVINELVHRWNELCHDGHEKPYRAVTFEAHDKRGDIIYHTDCLFSLLGKHAFACLDAIRDDHEREQVLAALASGPNPLEVIDLSLDQIEQMAANAQCVTNAAGEYCIIQSQRGYDSLTASQKRVLSAAKYRMVVSQVDLIELVGGGSCRCMLVENWTTVSDERIRAAQIQNLSLAHAPAKKSLIERLESAGDLEASDEDSYFFDEEDDEAVADIAEAVHDQFVVEKLVQKPAEDPFFFEGSDHERTQADEDDDFFGSSSSSDDYTSAVKNGPQQDYWDRQFFNDSEDLKSSLPMMALRKDNFDVKLKAGKRYPRSLRRTESQHEERKHDDQAERPDLSALAAATSTPTRALPKRKATFDGSSMLKLARKVSSFFFSKASTAEAADAEHAC